MKLKAVLTIILLLNTGLLAERQSDDEALITIRTRYQLIREALEFCNRRTIDIDDQSTEGGQATAYFAADELQMIALELLGETGKWEWEFYFDRDRLFFVLTRDFRYNRPFYWDAEKAREFGDTEVFDPEKSIIRENRYYFDRERLFLWLDHDRQTVDLNSQENSTTGRDILARAGDLFSKLKE